MILRSKICVVLFMLLEIHFSLAQTPTTDSLKTLLKNAKHDTVRGKLLGALCEFEYDDKIWPLYNDELYELSQNKLKVANSPREKILYKMLFATAVNNKGYLAQELGDIVKALEYYFAALELQEQMGDRVQMAVTINNIAYIYMNQGDMDKSMLFVNKALKIQKEEKNNAGIAASLNNLGNLYRRKKEYSKAISYFSQALELNRKINYKDGIGICLSNIGATYLIIGLPEKAEPYFLEALKFKEIIEDQNGMSNVLSSLANTKLALNKPDEALEYGLRSLNMARDLNYIENIRNASSSLYKIYKKQNKEKEALQMYELFIVMRDSIMNEATRQSSFKKDLQYSYGKKATADSVRVEEDKKVVQAELKQERTKNFALYGGIALVGLFSAFMYNRFRITQKQNALIKEQKAELQEQKELIEEAQKETLDSIHYAKRIQTALIANSKFINEHIPNNFIFFNPKDIVSGDFYWATHYNNKFYLAVCDCTGHGVPGAFMSLLNIGFLSEAIKEKNISKPNEIFNYVRGRLIETISSEGQQDGMDGILICIDKNTKTIEYCAANNEPILIHNNSIVELAKDKMPVGKGERSDEFKLHSLELKPGDTLYLYTDGFADQFGGPKGKKFKYKQLNELLLSLHNVPLHEQKQILEQTFRTWKGNLEQVDDVLIAGIKI